MSNSILVSDLTSDIGEDKLEIHFQKRKNGGGGDVKSVKLIENNTKAIVEFEEEQTAKSVLSHVHEINGRTLKVEKYEDKLSDKVFIKVKAVVSSRVEKCLGIETLIYITEKCGKIEIKEQNGKFVISTDTLGKVLEFEEEVTSAIQQKKHDKKSNPPLAKKRKPVSQQSNHGAFQNGGSDDFVAQYDTRPTTSNSRLVKPTSYSQPDYLMAEQSNVPPPQPRNGFTASQTVGDMIKTKFCFPAGDIMDSNNLVSYPSHDCTVCLPATNNGKTINKMLEDAFNKRKLFFMRKDTLQGFKIQSAYDMLENANQDGEVDLANKLAEVRTRLIDLGIPVPDMKKNDDKGPELQTFSSGRKTQPRPGPFPQPDGLKFTSEYHDKSLPGFPNCGAIHMYFRFPGGIIDFEQQSLRYVSYNRSTCLPATDVGRKLFAMITDAVNKGKLFVVSWKSGEYVIRTKVLLLLSAEYPKNGYLDDLYGSLLKLGISEPTRPLPLPKKIDAHYEEPSDDESEKTELEILRKGGPFPQPQNGVINMEKDEKNLRGSGNCGTINIYFRFAGGKMKIKGNKPSKSFEVQYSQMMESVALPGNDEGRKLAMMLRTAFNDSKLFIVMKREGEPSFRVRPRVTFLTASNYPNPGYLDRLRKELLGLGIREPSIEAINSLVIPKLTTPQGGALPASLLTSTSTTQQGNYTPVQTRIQSTTLNNGARPKVRTTPLNSPNMRSLQSPSNSSRVFGMPSSVERNTGVYRPPSNVIASDSSDTEEKCSICLGPISSAKNKTLQCKHTFHEKCVDMAIKSQKTPFCPFCKQPITSNGNTTHFPTQTHSNLFNQPTGFIPNSPILQPMVINTNPATFPYQNHRQRNYRSGQQQNPFPNAAMNYTTPLLQPSTINTNPPTFPYQNHRQGNIRSGQQQNPFPNAWMNYTTQMQSLPGYHGYNTIVINYFISAGVQGNNHPNPGVIYEGTNRTAYLPDNTDGRELVRLLERAFNSGLTFTVGQSQSSGKDNQIIWNGIPHKTNVQGGKSCYGYPDPNYLAELRQALASKGIQ